MNLRTSAVRGVAWSAAGNLGNQVGQLVVFVVLSRLLVPDDFGLVALASVFTVLLRLIAEQGLADAIVQHPELEEEHLDTGFWISAMVASGFGLALAVSAPLIGSLLDEPDITPVLLALSAILPLSSLKGVQRAILMRELQFRALTTRDLVAVSTGGVAGVVAAVAGAGVWSLVIQLLTAEALGVLLMWQAVEWRPSRRFSRAHFRELASFGASVVGYRLLRFLNTRIDNLLVGVVLGITALGFYVVAYRLLEIMINLTTSIVSSVAFPLFSRIQGERDRIRDAYHTVIGLNGAVAFPAYVGLIAVAPEVTELIFGGQWAASVPTMRVLAMVGVLRAVLDVNGVVMKALGVPGRRLMIMGLTSAMLVVAFSAVVDRGILAVAIAFVGVSYVAAPLWIREVHRLIGLDAGRYIRRIAPALMSSVVMLAAVLAVKVPIADLPLAARTSLLVATGLVAYLSVLWVTGRGIVREGLAMTQLAVPGRRVGA
ncbi:MAG: lipopolysaccharide biosynthesis protein [Acidimicrobiales bacterium]